jgi:hypothetical protein
VDGLGPAIIPAAVRPILSDGGGPCERVSGAGRRRVPGSLPPVPVSDPQEIASAITRTSAERLGLAEGDEVIAVIKATEVLIGK